jgi:Anti-sigma-K factor rskA
VVTALGAAAVTAAAFIGAQTFQAAAPAVAASFVLRPQPGQTGSATATAYEIHGGHKIQLTAKDLPKLGPGQFFECWYVGPNNRPGHPQLITAGTFTGSNGTFTMWSAADPGTFKVMQITQEQAGAGSQQGKVILSGTAQTG